MGVGGAPRYLSGVNQAVSRVAESGLRGPVRTPGSWRREVSRSRGSGRLGPDWWRDSVTSGYSRNIYSSTPSWDDQGAKPVNVVQGEGLAFGYAAGGGGLRRADLTLRQVTQPSPAQPRGPDRERPLYSADLTARSTASAIPRSPRAFGCTGAAGFSGASGSIQRVAFAVQALWSVEGVYVST